MEKSDPAKFKENLVNLCSLIVDFYDYADKQGTNPPITKFVLMTGRSFFVGKTDDLLIDQFCQKSWQYWDRIKSRDEEFFLKNAASIFAGIPDLFISQFVSLITMDYNGSRLISKETLDDMWAHLEAMVKISIRYVHERRTPKKVDSVMKYTVGYVPGLSIKKNVELFEVTI